MNIQIFGRSSSFDTKKAQRWFKERRISFQYIDLNSKGMSKGEFTSVLAAVKDIDTLLDAKAKGEAATLFRYLGTQAEKQEKLLENPQIIAAPIVRSGRLATVGFCPEVWKNWE